MANAIGARFAAWGNPVEGMRGKGPPAAILRFRLAEQRRALPFLSGFTKKRRSHAETGVFI